ncbi:hypothetical protein EVAR_47139_1 [Eumeta japonica]|uniref:Uncharacterized protein n=1 Tax=Eumeta variegata TaxID=151549 RepID=A0A4C1XW93_EUMVA|nr:hypothetical protein EVAR_47139_1 [Eumeta japonica]
MSILHTLAPVRVGSVGLKPTKKVPLKVKMSPETVTSRFPFLLPGRERSAAAGWSKGAQVDDLTIGLTYSNTFRAYGESGWETAADSQPPLEGAHWDKVAEDGAPSPTPKKERGIISEKRELDAGLRARYVFGVRGVQEGREGGALRNSGSD